MSDWGFLSRQALVIVYIFERPRSTLLQISQHIGVTERATTTIIRQLENAGFVSHVRVGRQSQYTVDIQAVMDAPTKGGYTLGDLLRRLFDLFRDLLDGDEGEDGQEGQEDEGSKSDGSDS